MPSQNLIFVRSEQYPFNGIAFNQLEAPFSLAKSGERISFFFNSLLIFVFFSLLSISFYLLNSETMVSKACFFKNNFCCFSDLSTNFFSTLSKTITLTSALKPSTFRLHFEQKNFCAFLRRCFLIITWHLVRWKR